MRLGQTGNDMPEFVLGECAQGLSVDVTECSKREGELRDRFVVWGFEHADEIVLAHRDAPIDCMACAASATRSGLSLTLRLPWSVQRYNLM